MPDPIRETAAGRECVGIFDGQPRPQSLHSTFRMRWPDARGIDLQRKISRSSARFPGLVLLGRISMINSGLPLKYDARLSGA